MTNNTVRILAHIDSGKNPNDSTPFFLVRVELVTPNGSYPISDHGPYGTEAFAVEAAQTIMKNIEANAPAIFAKLGSRSTR